ncbi:hypothetical protein F5Y08DRAFT_308441 [Xylaria arbuscula]|nr:hypothetical protein F5Y08DRAFT_308441 [Xylaria arbuscula]
MAPQAGVIPPGIDPCAIPAALPPGGGSWNFDNPTSLSTVTIAVGVIVTVLAAFFVAIRIYTNRTALRIADYFVIIGTVFDLGFTSLIIAQHKSNRHQWDVPACWLDVRYIKSVFSNTLLVGPALYFSKSAIFLMYHQFFSVDKTVRIAIYIGLISTFLVYFPSIPLSAYYDAPHIGETWEDVLTNGSPFKLIYWGVVQGSLSVVLDFYIFILPLPMLSKLQLRSNKKRQLVAIFATALLGVAASIVALYFRVELLNKDDGTWKTASVNIAVMVENNVALIVASMPTFATFFKLHLSNSLLVKRLESIFPSSETPQSDTGENESPTLRTFGSPHRKVPRYYELTETTMMSQSTVPDGTTDQTLYTHEAPYTAGW